VAYFNVLLRHSSGEDKENNDKLGKDKGLLVKYAWKR
jgi:hypothetical protein